MENYEGYEEDDDVEVVAGDSGNVNDDDGFEVFDSLVGSVTDFEDDCSIQEDGAEINVIESVDDIETEGYFLRFFLCSYLCVYSVCKGLNFYWMHC